MCTLGWILAIAFYIMGAILIHGLEGLLGGRRNLSDMVETLFWPFMVGWVFIAELCDKIRDMR